MVLFGRTRRAELEDGTAVKRHTDGGVGDVEEGKSNDHGKITHCASAKDRDETGTAMLATSNQRTNYVLHKPPNDIAISSDCETNKAS